MPTTWVMALALRAAWAVFRQNRWRSLLTLTICGLGTAGVVVAGVLGKANVREMQARLRNLGGGLLVVSPNKVPPYPGRPRQLEQFISLQPEDGQALAAQMPGIQAVVPVAVRTSTVRSDRAASRVRLVGTTPEYLRVRPFPMASGRFLHAADDGQRVLVLGDAVSRELAAHGMRPGAWLALGGHPFEVVGVLRPQGINFAGEDEDHQVFIPLETYRQRVANRPWLSHLIVQLAPEADSTRTVQQVQARLRDWHGRWPDQVDDVIVRDFAEISAQQSGLLQTALWAVSAVGGLLLLLGGVGITTLMLLVVRQRRAEIGLRRALGATPGDIAVQFFAEGLVLTACGVLVGVGLGAGVAALLTRSMAVPAGSDFALVAWSAVVSLGAGSVACVIPALAGARLEPVAALRP